MYKHLQISLLITSFKKLFKNATFILYICRIIIYVFFIKMLKYFSKAVLRAIGWEMHIDIPENTKCVIITAPHTSNLDLVIGKLGNWAYGIKPKIMIKKEAFNFFISPILRMWGGIPVDRQNAKQIVDQIVKQFEETNNMKLIIAPEGTRKKNIDWKTGFYRIAQKANVPIYLGYVDFKTKKAGIHDIFTPTGNMQKDIMTIKSYYKDMQGFNKKQFEI